MRASLPKVLRRKLPQQFKRVNTEAGLSSACGGPGLPLVRGGMTTRMDRPKVRRADALGPLTVSQPVPPVRALTNDYDRHAPEIEAQRFVLAGLVAGRDWSTLSTPNLGRLSRFRTTEKRVARNPSSLPRGSAHDRV